MWPWLPSTETLPSQPGSALSDRAPWTLFGRQQPPGWDVHGTIWWSQLNSPCPRSSLKDRRLCSPNKGIPVPHSCHRDAMDMTGWAETHSLTLISRFLLAKWGGTRMNLSSRPRCEPTTFILQKRLSIKLHLNSCLSSHRLVQLSDQIRKVSWLTVQAKTHN